MEVTSINENSVIEFGKNQNSAALQVQKTYKSFRIRRQLADCAVLVEQRWWKLLDFAELKCSSISFFAIEKPETAMSRWSRARTRAAKVGKGLSKDDKARQLALQHWLEAIDPRHRYGHNLQLYYVKWLQCDSKQPFFYWLDVGEGKEVNLERCPRSKLQHQCIKYLGPAERKMYEVVIEDGKFIYAQSRKYVDTFRDGTEDVKWIFVLSASKTLYVGRKKKGTFQHSSFLPGGATLSAGRLIVEQGVLKAVWPHSGHYLPTQENFDEFMLFLVRHKVNLSVVQKTSNNEDEVSFGLRNSISAPDLNNDDPSRQYSNNDAQNINPNISRWSRKLHSKIGPLQIPAKDDCWGYDSAMFKTPHQEPASDSDSDGYETPDEFLSDSEFLVSKQNLFEYQESIPKEKIMKRINSHKGMRSYQLGDQLSCKWTTGAGPRIGCVRDYPKELQFLVLEDVHLSPRKPFSSPKGSLAVLVSS